MSISIKRAIEKIFSPAYNKKGLFAFFVFFLLAYMFSYTPERDLINNPAIFTVYILLIIIGMISSFFACSLIVGAINDSANEEPVFNKKIFTKKNFLNGNFYLIGVIVYSIILSVIALLIGSILTVALLSSYKIAPNALFLNTILFAFVFFVLMFCACIFFQFAFLNFTITLKLVSFFNFSEINALYKSCKGQILSYIANILILTIITFIIAIIPYLFELYIIFTSPLFADGITTAKILDYLANTDISIFDNVITPMLLLFFTAPIGVAFFTTIEIEINAQLLRYSKLSVDSFVENQKTDDDNTDIDDEIDDFN